MTVPPSATSWSVVRTPNSRATSNCVSPKRPAEELYDLRKDPDQIVNVAGRPEYAEIQRKLRARLEQWMKETGDPRATTDDDRWDRYPYFGPPAKKG
jgi:hypothetical protein